MMPDLASGLMQATPEISGHVADLQRMRRQMEEFRQDDGVTG